MTTKNIFPVIFGFIALLLISCSERLVENSLKNANQEAVVEEQNKKILNTYPYTLNIKPYNDGSWANAELNSQKFYSTYENLNDWRKIDIELKRIYETHKNKDYFHGSGQDIAGRFLNERLLLVPLTDEVKKEICFYTNMLVNCESVEWEILAKSLQKVNGFMPQKDFAKAISYIEKNAPADMNNNKSFADKLAKAKEDAVNSKDESKKWTSMAELTLYRYSYSYQKGVYAMKAISEIKNF